ncbi:octanoyltransferase [Bhargavaea cecembensis]|uniref:Octanoyl-[GcvH]:protein N-octanoyltransferase n=1 Tax=Bhargavaea cecembensis TaxID=394098 RepID=A0A163FDV5_9BACL|nr:lipoate--protein ligase family protein [Bhargavaea cecembensis]KZE38471.1 octanoyltransferase [Bhargavaea cecembensis]
MEQTLNLLRQPAWRFIDQSVSGLGRSALESFAMDDTLCHVVGQRKSMPSVRTWVHDRTIVLGIQDHRLPYIEDATELLRLNGWRPIVRNSGGLAVVLDEGILNITIALSEKGRAIDIPAGYEVMLEFVRMLLPEAAGRIEAYEIVGSYCPGSYDLSIGGRKFAGISQRRLRGGIAVQIYLCVEGSGSERARLIGDMYAAGLKGEETKFEYPSIRPGVMASLSELLGAEVTVTDLNSRVRRLLHVLSSGNVRDSFIGGDEIDLYTTYLKRVVERNAKLLEGI